MFSLVFWGSGTDGTVQPYIGRATLSGKDPQIISEEFGVPLSLTLDEDVAIVYWISNGAHGDIGMTRFYDRELKVRVLRKER